MIRYFGLLIGIGFLTFAGLSWTYLAFAPVALEDPVVNAGEYGIVQYSGPCRTVKSGLYCRVTTDLSVYEDMKVSSFPGKSLNQGDRIFVEHRDYLDRKETALCKNQQCTVSSICSWWMPCYTAKPKTN